jgi:2-C-methyl-D-erythritol 4-phosphate cytidylyltransferase/2-C-methyl-D-erythritol 2,4-cyclodiphosphate synthase
MLGSSEITDYTDVAIIVVAAGTGVRSGPGAPKQYRKLAGRPMLAMTLANLAKAAPGARILPVIDKSATSLYRSSLENLPDNLRVRLMEPAAGGATRQESARLGLECAHANLDGIKIVLIHDAARPNVSSGLVVRAIEAARLHGCAVPAVPTIDTLKEIDAEGVVIATLDRSRLRAVQTPQAFDFQLILDSHLKAFAGGVSHLTDDAAVAEWAGHSVTTFAGEIENMKVTTPEDFARLETTLMRNLSDLRVGQGFDVHAFGPGDHVWLGGVKVPHDLALVGHSDADVLMHAITDAILGAIADGDIGSHFPPSDPQWKGAASDAFLRHAIKLVHAKGGIVAHVDATLVCEAPKVGPHRDAIRASLAAIMGMTIDRVAVKATTSERLGFTGRGEGIAAMATATIRLPG